MASENSAEYGRAIAHEFEQVSGRVWTVDGSDSNTLHLALGCPHVDERLIHGDFDLNADGPRAIHIEDVSEESLPIRRSAERASGCFLRRCVPVASDGFDRGSRRVIARQHVLGATVWAYGGGGVRVREWTRFEDFSKFWRVDR